VTRLVAILAILIIGIVLGAAYRPFSDAIGNFLAPPPLAPSTPSITPLVLPRPSPGFSTQPPTLTAAPTAIPTPTPQTTRSFTIRLRGGGEMTVQANSFDAAINNVKSQGGDPADDQ